MGSSENSDGRDEFGFRQKTYGGLLIPVVVNGRRLLAYPADERSVGSGAAAGARRVRVGSVPGTGFPC